MAIWVYIRYGTARLRSSAFLSQVRPFSIPGPRTFRRGSAVFPLTGDGIRYSVPASVAGPRQNYGPVTQTPRTWDTTLTDRGRKPYGPGTARWWTGDAKMTDRGHNDHGPGKDTSRRPGTARWWTRDGNPTDRTQNGHGTGTQNSRGTQNSPRNSATPWQRTSSGTGSSRWRRR